jgi:protein-disulfide isomerase
LERQQQERRRRRRFRIAAVAGAALIAASVTTSLALHHGGSTNGKVTAANLGFGYPGPYAPVTLNADNSVTMAQPGVIQPILNVYEDFLCSTCRAFEKGSGAAIQRLADEGKVKVVYYPFTAFGSQLQQANSIRAWAAAKCVPANLWARYHNSLYASQPTQTAASGFAVNLLVQLGRHAGITNPSFAQCVQSQQYATEDLPLSDQIINSGVSNMLTVTLNGRALSPDLTSSELRQQIISASSGRTAAQAQAPAGGV